MISSTLDYTAKPAPLQTNKQWIVVKVSEKYSQSESKTWALSTLQFISFEVKFTTMLGFVFVLLLKTGFWFCPLLCLFFFLRTIYHLLMPLNTDTSIVFLFVCFDVFLCVLFFRHYKALQRCNVACDKHDLTTLTTQLSIAHSKSLPFYSLFSIFCDVS